MKAGSDATIPPSTIDHRPSVPTHVVGIGASAGGLEALMAFFGAIPVDSGMAFVVIQHLSSDFKSLMNELLGRCTKLAVHKAENRMLVEANTVYLLPAKKEMEISEGNLYLRDKNPAQSLSMPIDVFFRSLAHDLGERAIGVILSGTGKDGSLGARAINAAGGLNMAQSPESAKFDGMPLSAIDTGVVDHVLPPLKIAGFLLRHIAYPGTPQTVPQQAEFEISGHKLTPIFRRIREAYGIDFAFYKVSTIGRRIQRRMQLLHINRLDAYIKRVSDDTAEIDALYTDLLIGVTRFFRNPEAFSFLETQVIPMILKNIAPHEEIRVWVPGCATGEEAYSIAILMHEALESEGRLKNRIQVFATDVHRESLEKASLGLYEKSRLEHVPASRLQRYFTREKNRYRVNTQLRNMLDFSHHNLMEDPPFSGMDLVSCRNTLIYFEAPAQKRARFVLHSVLKTGGILFLGPSETCGFLNKEFETIEKHWKIYKKVREIPLPADMRIPLEKTTPRTEQFMVPYQKTAVVPEDLKPSPSSLEILETDRTVDSGAEGRRIALLEQELRTTRENLQTTNQELQTSNEELQTSNEELQTSNEELQTSNEELLHTSDELQSVNAAHEKRIEDLIRLTNDMENLIKSTGIGTIFLDRHLRINKYTPAITDTLQLLPQDIGRPFEEIAKGLKGWESFSDEIKNVISTGISMGKEIQNRAGIWFLIRITPYRNEIDKITGAVISSVDISQLKEAERVIREANAELELRVEERTRDLETANEALIQTNKHLEESRRAALSNLQDAKQQKQRAMDTLESLTETQQRLKNRAEWSLSFQKAGKQLTACKTVETLLEIAAKVPVEQLGLKMAWVCLFDTEGRAKPVAYSHPGIQNIAAEAECPAETKRTGEKILVPDVINKPPFDSCPSWAKKNGFSCCSTFPVFVDESVIATITVRGTDGSAVADMAPLLEIFCNQVGEVWKRCLKEKELVLARNAERKANESKSDFLASMSHELRTPLNAIIGFSEVMGEEYIGKLNEKQAVYVNDILESGKHLLALINDILDLTKIEARKLELHPSTLNLKKLLKESLVLIKEKARKRT